MTLNEEEKRKSLPLEECREKEELRATRQDANKSVG